MNEVLVVFKLVSLVVAIWFTSVNLLKASRGHTVSAINFFIMSLSIATFVTIQFQLYK